MFASPAGGADVEAPGVLVGDFALPAEFEEAAGSLFAGSWGLPGFVVCPCFAVKFVVPANACVEGA